VTCTLQVYEVRFLVCRIIESFVWGPGILRTRFGDDHHRQWLVTKSSLLLLAVYEFLKICMEVVSDTFNPQWSHFMLLFTTVCNYGILIISITKFCYYISSQNSWLIYLVDSVKFMGHPKPRILNLSKYFAINDLLLHIQTAGIFII